MAFKMFSLNSFDHKAINESFSKRNANALECVCTLRKPKSNFNFYHKIISLLSFNSFHLI